MTQDEARARIRELVDRFRDLPASQRNSYNEQQSREYFILPLFRALGWDTENPAEFTAEEQISRGFVDFGFYVDGVPRFYLETKRIPENLDDPRWGTQAINYAYLKGVTWAVLTDFEGLKVFNAEVAETNPARTIFLDLRWEDYAEDAFDQLWLLSRESIRAGALDRAAETWGRKARKRPVTEQLFAQLTQWRQELFKEIRGWDQTLWSQDPRAVDNAVQRLLDRLIFIRTVEDRGIESNRLLALVRQHEASRKKDKNLFQDLQALFRELDDVYNARLFAETTVDHVRIYNPDLIGGIIKGLYEAGFIQYNFNAIDADVLGAIYEQYLSFKAQDPEAKTAIDLEKRSKRKAQGIFYTPQFVVRYIVQNTLGKLLEAGADPHTIRVLDPACGSGSFLIEAFDVLDRWLEQHGTPQDSEFPIRRRLSILQNNLYGVDLDEQAVEVARLNLLLRAAGKREKLPMLNNIRCGNSLIDDPAVAGDAAFNWQEQFPEVFADGGFDVVIGNPPYVRAEWLNKAKDYFKDRYETYAGTADLYVYFIEKEHRLLKSGGYFGMIVSNKWMKAGYGKKLRQFLVDEVSLEKVFDLAGLPVFADATVRTVIMLSQPEAGRHEFIQYAPPPSTEAFEQIHTESDLAAYVQQNAVQYPTSYLSDDSWSLGNPGATRLVKRLQVENKSLKIYTQNQIYYGIKSGFNEAFVIDQATRDRLVRQDAASAEIIKPVLGGRDIRRYHIGYDQKYLIWTYIGIPIRDYPAVFAHLSQFQKQLEARWDKGEHWWELRPCDYYAEFEKPKIVYPDIATTCRFTLDKSGYFLANTAYIIPIEDLYLLGILNSRLSLFYFTEACAALEGEKDSYLRFIAQYTNHFPVREIDISNPRDKANHARMVELVGRMLDLQQQHAAAEASLEDRRHDLARQIARLDAEIDQLVYELYGLTPEEIAIVEGRTT